MQQIIANKYKPYYLGDFHIDEKTTSIIRTLLDIEDLNLLFIANTGSGKTALLYAILREYYGLSKTASISENNIMFINNLKEQGINYFRNEMKTFCQSQCSIYGKKKIIVIDDIDTINEQSQQVFRNYIDKYKSNIHFISSCTNVQKVIESIQSRLHIINIHFQPEKQMNNLLENFIKNENVEIDEQSKQYVLTKSENSVRQLLSLLEKFAIYGKPIAIDICEKLCTTLSFTSFENYLKILRKISTNQKITHRPHIMDAIDILLSIYDYGYSVIDIYDYFYTFIKQTQLINEYEKYKIINVLCKYITIFHNLHESHIELALFTEELLANIG